MACIGLRCAGLDFLADGFSFFAFGAHEFVIKLKIHPYAGGHAVKGAETEVVFGCAAAFTLFHLREVRGRNSAAAGYFRLGEIGFFECVAEGFGEEV